MSERVEKRKDQHGNDVDVVVVERDLTPEERLAAIEAYMDRHFPGWRKGA